MKKTARRALPLLALASLLAGAVATAKTTDHDAALARNLSTFNAMVRALEENYVDTIRIDEAFEQAIDAMLGTVDPYTEYYPAEDSEQLTRMTTGEYGGIGSFVLERDSCTFISGPYENSPAAKAGLRAGDKILFVDSMDVHTHYVKDVSKLLRGVPGTDVRLRIQRPYAQDSLLDITVRREKLQQPSVSYSGMLGDSIGYVGLTSFIASSPREVEEALAPLLRNPGLKGLVLDLRGNGGGLMESAVDIVGLFVPKGTEVLSTTAGTRRAAKAYRTRRNPVVPASTPVAVLIDGGSASASEITAGALQDLDRAVLVGSRSFGKGLVQSTLPLPFDGWLKVTTAKYLLPSGRLIQALDYSRRNPDGTVARTPDSLANTYRTAAGRIVRDGGGLQPDSTVSWERASSLLWQLVRDNKIFDYATLYASRHPSIAPASEFSISEADYDEFCASLDPRAFRYKSSTEQVLRQLREAAEAEGLDSAQEKEMLARADSLFAPDLKRDLERRRQEITDYINEEIIGRYHYERGKARAMLRHDPGLEAAISILTSPEYSRLLSPGGKEQPGKEKASKPGKEKASGSGKGNASKPKGGRE